MLLDDDRDCYLCSDYKESAETCFSNSSKSTLIPIPNNETHAHVIYPSIGLNKTIISVPCKGQKSEIVKCDAPCLISYDTICKVCKYSRYISIQQRITYQTYILVQKGCWYHDTHKHDPSLIQV